MTQKKSPKPAASPTQIFANDQLYPNYNPNQLTFLALGGCGDFGCNVYVYHYQGELLIVDCGFGFADERHPGVDLLLPDLEWLSANRERIVGLVVTHAHEDHLGAIGWLWPQLNCPIYTGSYAAAVLAQKLGERNLNKRAAVHTLKSGQAQQLGGFNVTLLDAAHSVAQSHMVVIRSSAGTLLHANEWRFDPNPILCAPTDEVALAALAAEQPLAIIGDSTNVSYDGDGLFERDLTPHLAKIFEAATGRVVLTCIASNIPRWLNVLAAAKLAGRQVGLVGRSLWRHHEAAVKCGLLKGHEFLTAEAVSSLPAHRTVAIATGSQGDRGSAMDRLSFGEHNLLKLHKGDSVLFSSRVIPGAEKAIMRMQNSLIRQNIKVITPDHATIHVSGHAYKGEVKKLYNLVKPKACIPIHGYLEGMQDHVDIAESCGVKHGIVPHNGDVISIGADGTLTKISEVPHGILAIDGTVFVRLDQATQLKERRKLAEDGSVMATILVDSYGLPIQDPIISLTGLMSDPKAQTKLCLKIAEKIADVLDQMGEEKDLSDALIKEQAHLIIRQHIRVALEKKPMITLHVVRIAD